jgi:hypothetical protein
MKNNIYFSKAFRTLSAVLACFVVMLSFAAVPEAFASGTLAEETLTATEKVECEINVIVAGAAPGVAANYASVGVESKDTYSGGARLNTFTNNSYPVEWTITPTYTGTVTIEMVHNHTTENASTSYKFAVDGTETFNNKLKGWTNGTTTVAENISVTKDVPFKLTWTPNDNTASARIFFDYMNITYSYLESEQVEPAKPLLENTVLVAEDATFAGGAEAVGDEVRIPAGGTAAYKTNEYSSDKAYKLYVNLNSGSEVGVKVNGEDLGIIDVSTTSEDVFVYEFIAPTAAVPIPTCIVFADTSS